MEFKLDKLIDALPGMVWISNSEGHAEFINHRWCKCTGMSSEEAAGVGWLSAVHPDELPRILACRQEIGQDGKSREIEVRLRKANGIYSWFLFRISALDGAPGFFVHWSGTNTDLDEHMRAGVVPDAKWWFSRYGREMHFRSITDGMPYLTSLITQQGVLEQVNDRTLEYFGMTFEELKNAPITRTMHPDDHPRVRALLSKPDAQPRQFESRLRRADGKYRWFHAHGVPLRDDTGRVVLWYFLQSEVDDRRRAEAMLAAEKELLELVAAGNSLPHILSRLCALFDALTEGYLSGVSLFDIDRTRVQQVVSENLPGTLREALFDHPVGSRAGPCGIAEFQRTQVIMSDIAADPLCTGSRWAQLALAHGLQSCWSSPIVSRTGELLGIFAVYQHQAANLESAEHALIDQFTQIAAIAIERTRSEEELRRSEAFLAKAQQVSSTGSYFWRVVTDEIIPSEQYRRIFEFDANEPVTIDRVVSRLHPEDTPRFREIVERARRGGESLDYECRLLMPDNSVKYVIFALSLLNQSGRPEYLGAVQDVTKRQLAEEALNKVRQELAHVTRALSLGTLAASIAHEVNQPLAGIITNASTCRRMLDGNPPNIDGVRKAVQRINRDGNRAADVISRLRTLFGKKISTREWINLNDAAREVIELSRRELRKSAITVRTEFGEDVPLVAGDRVQLQQVVLNFILNAGDAMSEVEGRPRVLFIKTGVDADGHVCLSASDTGVGINSAATEKLFQAFYTTKASGMGIGLSVSRSIIEAHKGRIWASPNAGSGATFAFAIPGAAREQRLAGQVEPGRSAARG